MVLSLLKNFMNKADPWICLFFQAEKMLFDSKMKYNRDTYRRIQYGTKFIIFTITFMSISGGCY